MRIENKLAFFAIIFSIFIQISVIGNAHNHYLPVVKLRSISPGDNNFRNLIDPIFVHVQNQPADTIKWPWPDSLDAVKAAPNSHKVLFENDKIRILEVTVEPFGLEPVHTHRYPSVMFGPGNDTSHYDIIYYKYDYDSIKHVYFVKDSIHQHGGGTGTGEHFMKPEGAHRIKNLSNVKIIAFRVEFKPT